MQSLTASGERPPADLIVWDEAHHCTASTYRDVANAYPSARHLGLTATPVRTDGTALGNVFDRLVVLATVRELQAEGWLVPCDVVAPPKRLRGGDIADDPIDAWTKHANGRRTVLFSANVAHAKDVAERFRAIGVTAASLDGTTPKDERDDVLARFRAGAITVVANAYILTEGWDCPEAEVCILARGCGSVAMFLQCVGRVLRPAAGKDRALLIDLGGAVHEHGMPDDDRTFSLEGTPIRPTNRSAPIRQCPRCGAVFRPKPVCPRCGAEMPKPPPPAIRHVGIGEVGAVSPVDTKTRYLEMLAGIAASRGYKSGWVAHKFKARFGHWPASRVSS